MSATLYLVGVGTGDPELLTLKAVRILEKTKIIAYGQKPNTQSVALNIAKKYLRSDAKFLPLNIPMKIEREPAQLAYDTGAKEILKHLQLGKDVAYICEGDPLFYASASYLIERMPEGINIEIIAGICSPNAAAAAIKRPLVARDEILKIIPATLKDEQILAELKTAKSVVLMKVGRHFLRIKNLLEKTGFTHNAMIVENASCANERIIKLNDYTQDSLPYFAIILAYKGDENWGK